MTDNEVVWLIEISLKDFEPNLPGGTRIVSFEEPAGKTRFRREEE